MAGQDKQTPATEDTKTIELDAPFKRGEQLVDKVTVRRPNVGALRGTSLSTLMSLDVGEIQKVLPRCTEPALQKHEIDAMDPADLAQLGMAVVRFLLPKKLREESLEA